MRVDLRDFVQGKGMVFSSTLLEVDREGCIQVNGKPRDTPCEFILGHARRIWPIKVTLTKEMMKRYYEFKERGDRFEKFKPYA